MSRGEEIVRVLRGHGFVPSPRMNAFYVEFTKDYADDLGRRARALVQLEKPSMRLSGFTVIVQAAVEPTVESVESKAPPVMRGDLTSLVSALSAEVAPSSVVVRKCEGGCGSSVNEFFLVDGKITCRRCKTGSWDGP